MKRILVIVVLLGLANSTFAVDCRDYYKKRAFHIMTRNYSTDDGSTERNIKKMYKLLDGAYLSERGFYMDESYLLSDFKYFLKKKSVRKKLKGVTRVEKARYLAKLLTITSKNGVLCKNKRNMPLWRVRWWVKRGKLQKIARKLMKSEKQ